MKLPRSLPALVATLALMAVAGCGDDEETTPVATTAEETTSTSSDDEVTVESKAPKSGDDSGEGVVGSAEAPPAQAQIQIATKAFLVSPDSDLVCRNLLTETAVKDAYGSVSACLQGRPKPTLAKSAKLEQPDVGDDEATAVAVPDGGLYDGDEVEFTFVAEDDVWLIDSVSADIPVGP